jgi:riboflavin synthase
MFTGIVQGVATVAAITDRTGLRSFRLDFPAGFATDLAIGASVAVDGVCLTVTALEGTGAAQFDVMQQSLALTTLATLREGSRVNVERAAKDGAEIGGHPISGHVDFQARLLSIRRPENNHVLRLGVPAPWMRYVFAKGYVAINGASLTVAEADRRAGWFEVWLIPETLRMTTLATSAKATHSTSRSSVAPRWWWTPCATHSKSAWGRCCRHSKRCCASAAWPSRSWPARKPESVQGMPGGS